MSKHASYVRHFRIFLSSPSDVAEERRIAREVIESVLPQRPALRGKASFEVVAWDHPDGDVVMPAGLTPQQAISRGLAKPSECDLTIVILWGRMGSPLPDEYRKPDGSRYLSGTEWEYKDALQAAPDSVFIYRRTSPPVPQRGDAAELRQMTEQAERLEHFFEPFKQADGSYTGSVNTYEAPAEFKEKLTRHLEIIVLERLPKETSIPAVMTTPTESVSPDWEFRAFSGNSGWPVEAVKIERVPRYRPDIIKRLKSEHFAQRYLRMLNAILALAERIWGPRGSSQALLTCIFFALVYGYVAFWLGVVEEGENPFAEAAGLGMVSGLALPQRGWLFGLVVLYPVALWPLGRWLGFIERRYETFQRRRRSLQARYRWSRRYHIMPGTCVTAFIVSLIWIEKQYGLLDVSHDALGALFVVVLVCLCPLIGLTWGRLQRTPWEALFNSFFGVCFTAFATVYVVKFPLSFLAFAFAFISIEIFLGVEARCEVLEVAGALFGVVTLFGVFGAFGDFGNATIRSFFGTAELSGAFAFFGAFAGAVIYTLIYYGDRSEVFFGSGDGAKAFLEALASVRTATPAVAFIGFSIVANFVASEARAFFAGFFGVFAGAVLGRAILNFIVGMGETVIASGALAGAGTVSFAVAATATATVIGAGAVTGAVTGAVAFAFVVAVAGGMLSVGSSVKLTNLFAAIMGSFIPITVLGAIPTGSNANPLTYFTISMLILPVMNGGLDYVSWRVSRFLGHDLVHGLSDTASIAATLIRGLVHITADLLLALIFFIAMAFALGFAFESYDLHANLPTITLFAETEFGTLGYAEELRNDPLGTGLWIGLMLLTTLIPTVIHFGMVVAAILPATLLPNQRRRALAEQLASLGELPPPKETPARETWAATIRDSAKFAAGYRWRMLWGVALTCGLLAALFWGLGQLYPHIFLTEWAYWGGVKGIEAARWFSDLMWWLSDPLRDLLDMLQPIETEPGGGKPLW